MTLPKRIAKQPKRSTRWRSLAHCNFVRKHACCVCGSESGIEVAHVRLGSGAGISQKPDDWRGVSLCRDDHRSQHSIGEATFWKRSGVDPEALIVAFIKASPRRAEIEQVMRDKANE
jgi:hypothetical protein